MTSSYRHRPTADQVTAPPVGELITTNVAAQLAELDARISAFNSIDQVRTTIHLADDFFMTAATDGGIGQLGWNSIILGAGAQIDLVSAEPWGKCFLYAGTTTTGYSIINLSAAQMEAAPVFVCEWCVCVDGVQDASNQYVALVGLHDTVNNAEPQDGFYFMFSNASANWRCMAADTGTRTNTDSGVAVTQYSTYQRLRIECDGGGTVRYYINKVPGTQTGLVATHTGSTNFPDTGDKWGPAAAVYKTLGAVQKGLIVDYFALDLDVPGGR